MCVLLPVVVAVLLAATPPAPAAGFRALLAVRVAGAAALAGQDMAAVLKDEVAAHLQRDDTHFWAYT